MCLIFFFTLLVPQTIWSQILLLAPTYQNLQSFFSWNTFSNRLPIYFSLNVKNIFSYVYVCLYATCVQVLAKARRGVGCPGTAITGGCEPPDMSAGNWTQVLWNWWAISPALISTILEFNLCTLTSGHCQRKWNNQPGILLVYVLTVLYNLSLFWGVFLLLINKNVNCKTASARSIVDRIGSIVTRGYNSSMHVNT